MEARGSPSSIDKATKRNRDRLSNLPEYVILHILSFLDMKEAMQTTILSTRWKYLWMSLPNLTFQDFMWKNNKDGFINFVDRVLLFRNNSDLHRFYFESLIYCFRNHIDKWITSAVRKHVEEVHLKIWSQETYELPHSLFTSTSAVKVFTLKSVIVPVQLPASLCSSSNLKSLAMVCSKLPIGNSNGKLVLDCPVLENLIIQDCDHRHLNVLNISAIQLKSLVVKNRYPIGGCKIELFTPNLTSLEFNGLLYEHYRLKRLSALVTANIAVTVFSQAHAQGLVQILQLLNYKTNLVITIKWVQNPTKPACNLERLAVQLNNLRCLKLITSQCYVISAINNLFESCPRLETLVWIIEECESRNGEEECKAKLSSESMFHHLKSVKVQNLNGCECELGFLEFILRNAVVLEHITITTAKAVLREKEKQLEEFCMKLNSLFKASSSVNILFLLKSMSRQHLD